MTEWLSLYFLFSYLQRRILDPFYLSWRRCSHTFLTIFVGVVLQKAFAEWLNVNTHHISHLCVAFQQSMGRNYFEQEKCSWRLWSWKTVNSKAMLPRHSPSIPREIWTVSLRLEQRASGWGTSDISVDSGTRNRVIKWPCVFVQSLSPVRLFVTLWTVARQAPLSMGFPRQEYWSGLPFPTP